MLRSIIEKKKKKKIQFKWTRSQKFKKKIIYLCEFIGRFSNLCSLLVLSVRQCITYTHKLHVYTSHNLMGMKSNSSQEKNQPLYSKVNDIQTR